MKRRPAGYRAEHLRPNATTRPPLWQPPAADTPPKPAMIPPVTLHRARGAFALRVARPAQTHPVGTVLCLHGFPDC